MKQKPSTRMDGPLVQGFFIKERSGMSDSLFQLEKVGFQANGNQILQDISFTVNKGEVIVFTGPSGSGKSTLLKLIGTEKKSLISFKTLLYSMRQFKRTCLFLPA